MLSAVFQSSYGYTWEFQEHSSSWLKELLLAIYASGNSNAFLVLSKLLSASITCNLSMHHSCLGCKFLLLHFHFLWAISIKKRFFIKHLGENLLNSSIYQITQDSSKLSHNEPEFNLNTF